MLEMCFKEKRKMLATAKQHKHTIKLQFCWMCRRQCLKDPPSHCLCLFLWRATHDPCWQNALLVLIFFSFHNSISHNIKI